MNARESRQGFDEPRHSFMCKEYSETHNSQFLLNSLDEFQINDSSKFYMEIYKKYQIVNNLRSF